MLAQGLKKSRHLQNLILSGCDLHPYLFMEIAYSLTINKSIKYLDLSSCNLNSFMLSYLFKRLSNNKIIQELNLYNNQNFTFQTIENLIQFILRSQQSKSQLKKLNLSHCNIDNLSLSLLCASLAENSTLISLNISLMELNPLTLICLAKGLSENNTLIDLNISYNKIKENGLKFFVENITPWSVRNLKYLNIEGNQLNSSQLIQQLMSKFEKSKVINLSKNGIKKLDEIFTEISTQTNKQLQQLKLSGNSLKDLTKLNIFHTLTHLDLSNNKIGFKGANQIAQILRQNPKWTHLCLDRNYIKSEGFNVIIYALRDNLNLNSLSIAYNNLDGESIICIIVNHDALSLEHLDITGNRIHYSIVFIFLKLMNNCRLKSIRFCDLDNDTLGEYSHEAKFSLNCEYLQELDFSGNEYISCAVIYSLQARFNKLEILNLKGCSPLHEEDLINLGHFIKRNDYLRNLNLRGLKIGKLKQKVIKNFAEIIKQNTSLKNINLSKNKLAYKEDNLQEILTNIGQSSNLEILDISQNGITQTHRQIVQKMLVACKNLKCLKIGNNQIQLESLICLDFDDQWDLFFKNKYQQQQQQQQQQNINLQNVKLKADDLRVLGRLLYEGEVIQELDLSNNFDFNNVNAVTYNKCKYVNTLNLCKQFFRNQDFTSYIFQNGQYLQQIIIKNCIFTYQSINNFYCALKQLIKFNSLRIFDAENMLTLQENICELIPILARFQSIEILKLKHILFNEKFCINLMHLLQNTKALKLIDLSYNTFSQIEFEYILKGFLQNNSIHNYILQQLKIPQQSFEKLFQCLYEQEKKHFKFADFSSNLLSERALKKLGEMIKNSHSLKFFTFGQQLVNKNSKRIRNKDAENKSTNQILAEQIQNSFTPIQNFEIFLNLACTSRSLRHLDLNDCNLKEDHIKILVKIMCTGDCFIKSLNIPNNSINEDASKQISFLLQNNKYISELNISNCNLSTISYQYICTGIELSPKLRCLDVSNNKDGDQFCYHLSTSFSRKDLKSNLKFLFINNLSIGYLGNNYLKQVYKFQTNIFIINNWQGIDNELATFIINSYVKIYAKYTFIPGLIPSYLRKLSITESYIDDNFLIDFAKQFHSFKLLKEINLSNNPKITSIGKIHLFINLFDIRSDNLHISNIQIDNKQQIANLLDCGIFQYFLWHLNNKYKNIKFIKSLFAKIICNEYLNNTQFQMNYGFNNNIQKQKIPKSYNFALFLHLIQFILPYIPLFAFFFQTDIFSIQIQNIFALSTIIFAFIVSGLELILVNLEKKKTTLLFQSDVFYSNNWKRYQKLQGLYLLTFSFIERYDTFADILLTVNFFEKKLQTLWVVSIIVVIFKFLFKLILFIYYIHKQYTVYKGEELSSCLQNIYKITVSQGFYLAENYTNIFSPSDSIKITSKIQINFKSFIYLIIFLFQTVPLFALYVFFLISYPQLRNALYGVTKSLIQIFFYLFSALFCKPSQISQSYFDEALITWQCKKTLINLIQVLKNKAIKSHKCKGIIILIQDVYLIIISLKTIFKLDQQLSLMNQVLQMIKKTNMYKDNSNYHYLYKYYLPIYIYKYYLQYISFICKMK
ncbi:leucine rich repeat protein [Ichthyophthirius multifiliis]|uniref:Leucine rich repeat protein n=1 Tax=Ichthyophthirius multifiliis TaxID=5932 RepID=G0QPP4_ICHMU|nr:leucine rich repeat protein [Ichthyophthirius multifiliis]EGR32805.1 leucine rich repeat protein [Ichthyophthirius multifiliis]|eukprot:XP_004036791.1 leucine rich repeat protein [Ichthyophthirius multifiliis]